MELFFAPLACSMASRICLYEAGADDKVEFCQVDIRAKRVLADGSDYRAVNPLGQVPALRTDEGRLLTENPAILTYIADRFPEAALGASDAAERYDLASWLGFIGAELHKQVFTPLISPLAGEGAKEFARASAASRLSILDEHLRERENLLDHFSVADAYLIVVLTWSRFVEVDLEPYPSIKAYLQRANARPSVSRALREEFALLHASDRGAGSGSEAVEAN